MYLPHLPSGQGPSGDTALPHLDDVLESTVEPCAHYRLYLKGGIWWSSIHIPSAGAETSREVQCSLKTRDGHLARRKAEWLLTQLRH